MTDAQREAVAEITHGALARCQAIGRGARPGGMKIYTTRIERHGHAPARTVTYVYDAPPPSLA